jgi:phosphoribosylanthranilate isomerase
VAVEIKFCGMTRALDVEHALSLGAAYIGVIFAESPRRISTRGGAELARLARGRARIVGVFGSVPTHEIAAVAREVGLDVVQLHGDPSAAAVAAMRDRFGGEVWGALRVAGGELPAGGVELLDAADAVVLDTKVAGRLGGTGVAFDWGAVGARLAGARFRSRIVLAGGLTAENVAAGVAALAPAVVDVSSGVEVAPGIKDHARMHAFANAVRIAETDSPPGAAAAAMRRAGD